MDKGEWSMGGKQSETRKNIVYSNLSSQGNLKKASTYVLYTYIIAGIEAASIVETHVAIRQGKIAEGREVVRDTKIGGKITIHMSLRVAGMMETQ